MAEASAEVASQPEPAAVSNARGFTLVFMQDPDGLWWMTNGTDRSICVCHRDLSTIISGLPAILRLWIKRGQPAADVAAGSVKTQPPD